MPSVDTIQIPNRSLFRQPEVCEIAQVQPYVLRSWEAEFPDLGVAKTEGGPRVYRRGDVERVLRIKHLLFVDGLTLAGARRKLQEEKGIPRSECAGARNAAHARRARAHRARASDAARAGGDARAQAWSHEWRVPACGAGREEPRPRGEGRLQARTENGRAASFAIARVGIRQGFTPQRGRLLYSPDTHRRRVASTAHERDVAQPGSAPDWGSGGRWFESSHPDQTPYVSS